MVQPLNHEVATQTLPRSLNTPSHSSYILQKSQGLKTVLCTWQGDIPGMIGALMAAQQRPNRLYRQIIIRPHRDRHFFIIAIFWLRQKRPNKLLCYIEIHCNISALINVRSRRALNIFNSSIHGFNLSLRCKTFLV